MADDVSTSVLAAADETRTEWTLSAATMKLSPTSIWLNGYLVLLPHGRPRCDGCGGILWSTFIYIFSAAAFLEPTRAHLRTIKWARSR